MIDLPRKPSAVIFDMDGVIFDTESFYRDAVMAAALESGLYMPLPIYLSTIGGLSSMAVRSSMSAAPCSNWLQTPIRSSANSSISTGRARPVHARWRDGADHHEAHDDQRRQVRELLSVQRHRDDLTAPDTVHHGRPGPFEGIQGGRLQARRRAEGTCLDQGCRSRRSLRPR